jgi:putative endonuclease
LYTGYARDPEAREKIHNSGRGARYTAGRRPVCLVYSESFESLGEALRREHELKCRSRAQKEALIGSAPSSPDPRRVGAGVDGLPRPDTGPNHHRRASPVQSSGASRQHGVLRDQVRII